MYLKSIEVHGFKSFANKILFQFHNGITAIVGPNGSGKSNVADAVRWVLGEQSARQLRGTNMQDVIFSGTEMRRPLGYASVSITLDNADHKLPVSYDEVTVTRRVYRSGESEYLLNGTQVRLKDINELFYDTGIGKEGYSIIGQGQIEKILSDRPEERRELFDEAAGIVKFKRRKNTALKKLENEKQSLIRVNDILSELTRQLGPMERQAETARLYLKKYEELKNCDVSLFFLENTRIKGELQELEEKYRTADEQLSGIRESYEKARADYDKLEKELEQLDRKLQDHRDRSAEILMEKQRLQGQIELANEQINTARANDELLRNRVETIRWDIMERESHQKESEDSLASLQEKQRELSKEETESSERLQRIREDISSLSAIIESDKNEIFQLLNVRASLKADFQRYRTMLEQTDIRKAQLSQRILQAKSEEALLKEQMDQIRDEEKEAAGFIAKLEAESEEAGVLLADIQKDLTACNQQFDQEQAAYHRESSRLESLINIAERYDGYGNSIRRVMEQKNSHPGILGVVADLIRTRKKYETAIETALGGSIQNIVTDHEETAKEMISFLKKHRYGRATFLPLTGITPRGNAIDNRVLQEDGVLGTASSLAETDPRFSGLVEYLLGRTLVMDTIDHAVSLAGKYRHTLRIVTLEGELLTPGGAITGGAFKNSSNLLGRRREINELKKQVEARKQTLSELQEKIDDFRAKRNRLRDDIVSCKEQLQEKYLLQNTKKIRLQELQEKRTQVIAGYEQLRQEASEIESEIRDIRDGQQNEQLELQRSEEKEKETDRRIQQYQSSLDKKREEEQEAASISERIHLNLASLLQQETFIRQNLARLSSETAHLKEELSEAENGILAAEQEAAGKLLDIEELKRSIVSLEEEAEGNAQQILSAAEQREQFNQSHKRFFDHREDLSRQMNLLDRECFRLNAQKEKLEEQKELLINYMWEEYQLTYSASLALREEVSVPLQELKRQISVLKAEIKALGNVNVNAIEDYRELSERHEFLTAQHDDLVQAEEDLTRIIQELDTGMRKQFEEQFSLIRKEFDHTFKELFGGGKGTLELIEEEDILEAGIRIIAQPPGKKLQNMMQLSGGEKAFTAIALLFAIQNLKPSPFCLLDEIEAALDESNVDRYARYLHKLTKHTQFIIITHRRGAMAAADRLYGITMQEKGISALVSVNLIEQELDE